MNCLIYHNHRLIVFQVSRICYRREIVLLYFAVSTEDTRQILLKCTKRPVMDGSCCSFQWLLFYKKTTERHLIKSFGNTLRIKTFQSNDIFMSQPWENKRKNLKAWEILQKFFFTWSFCLFVFSGLTSVQLSKRHFS